MTISTSTWRCKVVSTAPAWPTATSTTTLVWTVLQTPTNANSTIAVRVPNAHCVLTVSSLTSQRTFAGLLVMGLLTMTKMWLNARSAQLDHLWIPILIYAKNAHKTVQHALSTIPPTLSSAQPALTTLLLTRNSNYAGTLVIQRLLSTS